MQRDYHRLPYNPQWRHNHGHRQQFNQYRTPPLTGNENYWCETCDRGFPTEDLLAKHQQQHQKCNIDGCQFIAHPKVVTKHIQMQHSSGIYKKIANLNKPEEIEKWREERKKKYPTKANIDKKIAELKEKIDRGEKMGLERHRNRQNKDIKSDRDLKRKNNLGNENHPRPKFKRNNTNDNQNKKPPALKAKLKILPPVEENRQLKPFAGIQNLQMDSEDEIETSLELNDLIKDDEYEESISVEKSVININEPVVCGALSTLICDYGSSDDEGQEITNNSTTTEDLLKDTTKNTLISNVSIFSSKDDHAPNKATKITTNLNNSVETNKEGNSTSVKESTNNFVQNTIHEINVDNDDNDSGPEEVKGYKKSSPPDKNNVGNDSIPEYNMSAVKEDNITKSEKTKITHAILRKKNDNKQLFRRPRPKLPSTLLHKLLHKEMQQERNIVLQCIRYIRRNNYFESDEME